MIKSLIKFFDKLEDRIRAKLSRYPIVYGAIGGVGLVLFWRGTWHTADWIMESFFLAPVESAVARAPGLPWWDGPLSLGLSVILLLFSGIFVSHFVHNEIIISGLRGRKKLSEKTHDEIKTDGDSIAELRREIKKISSRLDKALKNQAKK